jgi:hypothetical protein
MSLQFWGAGLITWDEIVPMGYMDTDMWFLAAVCDIVLVFFQNGTGTACIESLTLHSQMRCVTKFAD